jgi:hypothetical protein
MRVRPGLALAVVLAAAPAVVADEIDARRDVETMEALLDKVVRRVSQPSAAPFFGATEASRAYRLQGYGVIFVVPPRALPSGQRLGVLTPPGPPVAAASDAPPSSVNEELDRAFAEEESTRRRLAADRPQGARARTARERELQAIEARVEALSQEAERQRAEAERELDAAMQQVRIRLMAPAPTGAATGGAPQPIQGGPVRRDDAEMLLPPAPPWRFWGEGADDPRKPDQVVGDVKAAVIQALETAGGRLRSVRPEESVVIAVDFVPQWDFGDGARAGHTVVVRARKKDLQDHDLGKLSTEELRKRIEAAEY